ncbi:IQ and ubiquitin-like domain-containing protein [Condylostylus longicornis]|uniref:IQ and ubiquitin-like domain-containing protein n=1 Tax=Condylostylus longicornis TaxID=2530218 RepID=UPI00244D9AF7|nr:IQ and ubiquitin-like domain-containing protein [Condylostylus longicornis]
MDTSSQTKETVREEREENIPDDSAFEYRKVTVKFQISDTEMVAQVYPNCLTIAEIKQDIGKKFEVDPKFLILRQFEGEYDDDYRLYETCSNEFGIVEFCLEISDKAITEHGKIPELNLHVYYSKFRLADFITVHIPEDETTNTKSKDILVEIHNESILKPFLGGYKDKVTGIDYFDAFTQTGPPVEKIKTSGIYSRDTQTVLEHTKSIDTMIDSSTQAFGNSNNIINVESANDVIIIPRKYQPHDEKKKSESKFANIVLIQRNWRRYLWQRLIKEAAGEFRRLQTEQARREETRGDTYIDRFSNEAATKTFSSTREDFEMLMAQVGRWKQAETARIKKMFDGGPRIVELNLLLDKEIELINGIEHQKQIAKEANKEIKENKMLEKLSKPIKWIGYKNLVIEMDLLRTQRVRYLNSIYQELKQNTKCKSKRIETLNKAKKALENEDVTAQVNEILDLFEREKNMLLATKHCELDVLHKRQQLLFLDIIKYCKDRKPDKPETRMCDTCKCIKPINDFALRTRQTSIETCNRCFYLMNTTSVLDNSVFKAILRSIQRDERSRRTLSSYAFILQEEDIKYIICKIWHGHSILSKCSDIEDLRLPRWNKADDWSPWNCVCLTSAEARHHNKLNRLEDTYDEGIRKMIKNKHLLGRTAFKRLQAVETDFVESGEWWKVGLNQKAI